MGERSLDGFPQKLCGDAGSEQKHHVNEILHARVVSTGPRQRVRAELLGKLLLS